MFLSTEAERKPLALVLQCYIINAQTTQTVPCQYKSEKNISITKGKSAILT